MYIYFSVESPVLSRLKQNRKRRQLQNEEDTNSPKGACKRLRLEKISVAEDAASADDDADNNEKEKLPVKSESSSPSLRQKSIEQYEKDLDATHFSELVSENQGHTDRSEKQSTTVSSSKWTKCDQCSKRVLKEELHIHIGFFIMAFQKFIVCLEKLHKTKNLKVVVQRVTTSVENPEDQSEEVEVETPGELDTNSSQRSEETSDDRSEEPESSPTKVIVRENDLVKYTKPFTVYLTPLTKEEIDKYTNREKIQSSSSSDSEFDEMVSAW